VDSCFVDRDVGGDLFDPATGVEVVDPVAGAHGGKMCVSAEDAVGVSRFRIAQGAFGYLLRETQPACAEAVEGVRELLALCVPVLQLFVDTNADAGEEIVLRHEAIELVAVDGNMALSAELPDVALVDGDAHEVRHQVGEAQVMIAFHPDDLLAAAGVGEPPDLGEEIPVVAGETCEVEIGEDIAKKDQAIEGDVLEKLNGVCRPADFRAEVKIGQDEGVAGLSHDVLRMAQ